MKLVSLVSFIAAAALPASVFAADANQSNPAGVAQASSQNSNSMQVLAVKGSASSIVEGSSTRIIPGANLSAGTSIETSSGSEVVFVLPNGARFVAGPNTRFRIRTVEAPQGGNYSVEIFLLRGRLVGETGGSTSSSTFNIRTASGVANVAGSSFMTEFTPSGNGGGQFNVAAQNSPVRVTPISGLEPVIVPAGSGGTFGLPNQAAPVVRPLSPQMQGVLQNGLNTLAGFRGMPAFRSESGSASNSGRNNEGSGDADSESNSGAGSDKASDVDPAVDATTNSPASTLPNIGLIISPNGEGNGL